VAAVAVVAGCGFVTIASAHGVAQMVVGLILNGIGTGLLIPTLLAMTMGRLPFELRGRGMGMGSFFIGQFASPIVVNVLGNALGRLPNAIGLFGWVSLFAGCAGAGWLWRGRRARGPRVP
jgi:MFS family permease